MTRTEGCRRVLVRPRLKRGNHPDDDDYSQTVTARVMQNNGSRWWIEVDAASNFEIDNSWSKVSRNVKISQESSPETCTCDLDLTCRYARLTSTPVRWGLRSGVPANCNGVSYDILSFLIPNPQHTVSLYTFIYQESAWSGRSGLSFRKYPETIELI
jgi:hypothetical protein